MLDFKEVAAAAKDASSLIARVSAEVEPKKIRELVENWNQVAVKLNRILDKLEGVLK